MRLLALCAGCADGATPHSFYLSPIGNDAWSGTLATSNAQGTDGPFRTLAAAKAAMESSAVKIVMLRAGTYRVEPHFFLNHKGFG